MNFRRTIFLLGAMIFTFGLLFYAFALLYIQSLSLEIGGWTVRELIRGESVPVYPAIQWAARIPLIITALGALSMLIPICYTISERGGLSKPMGELVQKKDTAEK